METNLEMVWKLITSFIVPDLMDRFVITLLAQAHNSFMIDLQFGTILLSIYLILPALYFLLPFFRKSFGTATAFHLGLFCFPYLPAYPEQTFHAWATLFVLPR